MLVSIKNTHFKIFLNIFLFMWEQKMRGENVVNPISFQYIWEKFDSLCATYCLQGYNALRNLRWYSSPVNQCTIWGLIWMWLLICNLNYRYNQGYCWELVLISFYWICQSSHHKNYLYMYSVKFCFDKFYL